MDTAPEQAVYNKYIQKFVNTKLIKDSGFSDGYGSLRNSESRTEEISFFNTGKFLHHISHIIYLGSFGSNFSEKKYKGTWGISVRLNNDLSEKEIAFVLNYEGGARELLVFEIFAKGLVKVNGANYRWTRL